MSITETDAESFHVGALAPDGQGHMAVFNKAAEVAAAKAVYIAIRGKLLATIDGELAHASGMKTHFAEMAKNDRASEQDAGWAEAQAFDWRRRCAELGGRKGDLERGEGCAHIGRRAEYESAAVKAYEDLLAAAHVVWALHISEQNEEEASLANERAREADENADIVDGVANAVDQMETRAEALGF